MAGYKTQLAITNKYAVKLKKLYLDYIAKSVTATNWDWVAKNVPYGDVAVFNAIQWSHWDPIPLMSKAYNEMADKFKVQKEDYVIPTEDKVLRGTLTMPNPAAEQWLLQYAAQEVTGIQKKTKEMIKNVIYEGQRDGVPIRETARRLRDHIGLTEGQEIAVNNYVETLKKQGLKEERIARLEERYYNKLLRYRAETIGITESHTATSNAWINQAQDQLRRGVLQGYEFEWLVTPDDRLCPVCLGMKGKTGSIASGGVEGGQRPPLHPRCRCVLITKKA